MRDSLSSSVVGEEALKTAWASCFERIQDVVRGRSVIRRLPKRMVQLRRYYHWTDDDRVDLVQAVILCLKKEQHQMLTTCMFSSIATNPDYGFLRERSQILGPYNLNSQFFTMRKLFQAKVEDRLAIRTKILTDRLCAKLKEFEEFWLTVQIAEEILEGDHGISEIPAEKEICRKTRSESKRTLFKALEKAQEEAQEGVEEQIQRQVKEQSEGAAYGKTKTYIICPDLFLVDDTRSGSLAKNQHRRRKECSGLNSEDRTTDISSNESEMPCRILDRGLLPQTQDTQLTCESSHLSVDRDALEGFLRICSEEKEKFKLNFVGFLEDKLVVEKVKDYFLSVKEKKRLRPSNFGLFDQPIKSQMKHILRVKIHALLKNCRDQVDTALKDTERQLLDEVTRSASDCFVKSLHSEPEEK